METAQDVLDELKLPGLAMVPVPPARERRAAQRRHRRDGRRSCDLDTLIARTRIGPDALGAALVELELEGHVAALPGGRWQRGS